MKLFQDSFGTSENKRGRRMSNKKAMLTKDGIIKCTFFKQGTKRH